MNKLIIAAVLTAAMSTQAAEVEDARVYCNIMGEYAANVVELKNNGQTQFEQLETLNKKLSRYGLGADVYDHAFEIIDEAYFNKMDNPEWYRTIKHGECVKRYGE